MLIQNITATSVQIPYDAPVGPYQGRGRRQPTRGASGLIVKIETDAGLVGWGEGTGTLETDPTPVLKGHHAADLETALSLLEKSGISAGPMSGIEMALWDLIGKQAGLPICRLMGGIVRTEIDFCACMGLKDPGQSAETALAYADRWGFQYIKTKAGDDADQDYGIARAVQDAAGDRVILRPDANSGYTPEQAESLVRKLADIGIRYFEDPCAPTYPDALARFREDIGMGILVNAGVRSPKSVKPVLVAKAADMLMPDTPSTGGLSRVRKITEFAEAWGVACLMHCSHDLGLKTAAVTQIAASTPNFSGPNDTCYHGLVDDILVQPLRFENGQLRVPMAPGLGVEVDESKVEKYRR